MILLNSKKRLLNSTIVLISGIIIFFLGLGTNWAKRLSNLEEAISSIDKVQQIRVVLKSKIYETSPMENLDQDNLQLYVFS